MTSKQSAFAVTVLVLGALIQKPALAAPGSAAGRKHAAKANQLAAQNRCNAAVAEFTKAYRLLKDPALLFNRAECYRRIGRDSQAVKDYEQFLAEMPHAPNRSTVEARIASLRGGAQAAAPTREKLQARRGVGQSPPGATHADKWGGTDVTPVGEKGHASDTRSMAIGAAAPAVPEPRAAANLTTQPVVPEPKQAGRSHAWIWIGTAVVVAGMGAVAAYHYWPRPKTDVPETPLGNYAF